jgi:two-component system, chemotaxis family, response regulator Rcp1
MEILLVEDNEADAYLTKKALRAGLPASHVTVVEDGEKAMLRLQEEGTLASDQRTELIVLDINLPRLDGFDVLARLRENPRLSDIPTIILSSSTSEGDVERAYRLGAYHYLTKPMTLHAYLGLGHAIAKLWRRWTTHGRAQQPE